MQPASLHANEPALQPKRPFHQIFPRVVPVLALLVLGLPHSNSFHKIEGTLAAICAFYYAFQVFGYIKQLDGFLNSHKVLVILQLLITIGIAVLLTAISASSFLPDNSAIHSSLQASPPFRWLGLAVLLLFALNANVIERLENR